jgi:CheY-like chemotaxis protein
MTKTELVTITSAFNRSPGARRDPYLRRTFRYYWKGQSVERGSLRRDRWANRHAHVLNGIGHNREEALNAGMVTATTDDLGRGMGISKSGQRHVLLIGALEGGLSRVAPMLQRAEFDVHAVEPSDFVLDLVLGTTFELLVVGYPIPEMDVHQLLRTIRAANSGTRNAGLLLLSDPGFLDAAQSLVSVGANRAVSLDWPASRLWRAVGDLLNVAPRINMRSLVHANVNSSNGDDSSLFQSVNVSISGMLLLGTEAIGPGSHFDFIFSLPGDPRPLEGSAEVVRRANPNREGIQGIGARFLHFREDGKYRLERFIASRHK